ncbi:16509_t:CDS:2, partial [Gigaspora rosea]
DMEKANHCAIWKKLSKCDYNDLIIKSTDTVALKEFHENSYLNE